MENNYHDPAQRAPKQPEQSNQQQQMPPLPHQSQTPAQSQQQPLQAPQQHNQQPQYQPPQQQYQHPNQQQTQNYQQNHTPTNRKLYPPIKIGEWIGVIIVMAIPLVNFIMLLVWAFGNGNPSKSNWAKATLLIGVIGGVLASIIYLIVFLVAKLSFS